MSHQVSPLSFRLGKTFLWNNNLPLKSLNSQTKLVKNSNLSYALNTSLDYLLKKHRLFLVKSSSSYNSRSGFITINGLVYPLTDSIKRKVNFPIYTFPKNLISSTSRLDSNFLNLLKKLWVSKSSEFDDRFISSKRKKNLNKWLTKRMFRGSSRSFRFCRFLKWKNTVKSTGSLKNILLNSTLTYLTKKNWWKRWKRPRKFLNTYRLSKYLGLRTGLRVRVKLHNIFSYLIKKNIKLLEFKTHQEHIWGPYHFNKKFYSNYYDVVNSLFILSYIPKTEFLFLNMIKHGLWNMHRRRIKPKKFFYFIDSALKRMTSIQRSFKSFRVIITGKLRGGTARTTSYSAGFGVFPKQTLSEDVRYLFGDVGSKYGSFGIKIITWRKK